MYSSNMHIRIFEQHVLLNQCGTFRHAFHALVWVRKWSLVQKIYLNMENLAGLNLLVVKHLSVFIGCYARTALYAFRHDMETGRYRSISTVEKVVLCTVENSFLQGREFLDMHWIWIIWNILEIHFGKPRIGETMHINWNPRMNSYSCWWSTFIYRI